MRLALLTALLVALVVPAVSLGATSAASHSASASTTAAVAKKKHRSSKRQLRRESRSGKSSFARSRASSPVTVPAVQKREAKGPITALGAASITVGTLTCDVPAAVSLGTLAVGDLVELTCVRTAADAPWALRKVEREDGGAQGLQEIEVKGPVTALGAGTISVGTVTCTIPAGVVVTGIAVGDLVELKCLVGAAETTLVKVEREDEPSASDDSGDDHDGHEGSGSGSGSGEGSDD